MLRKFFKQFIHIAILSHQRKRFEKRNLRVQDSSSCVLSRNLIIKRKTKIQFKLVFFILMHENVFIFFSSFYSWILPSFQTCVILSNVEITKNRGVTLQQICVSA
jgi:hypothetical protein